MKNYVNIPIKHVPNHDWRITQFVKNGEKYCKYKGKFYKTIIDFKDYEDEPLYSMDDNPLTKKEVKKFIKLK